MNILFQDTLKKSSLNKYIKFYNLKKFWRSGDIIEEKINMNKINNQFIK